MISSATLLFPARLASAAMCSAIDRNCWLSPAAWLWIMAINCFEVVMAYSFAPVRSTRFLIIASASGKRPANFCNTCTSLTLSALSSPTASGNVFRNSKAAGSASIARTLSPRSSEKLFSFRDLVKVVVATPRCLAMTALLIFASIRRAQSSAASCASKALLGRPTIVHLLQKLDLLQVNAIC